MKRWALILALIPGLALSEITPLQGKKDARIRVVSYDPMQVYRVDAFFGVGTRIQFEKDEKILDGLVGDEAAWVTRSVRNILFLKPKAEFGDTNMQVVTDKREYNFTLVISKRDKKDPTAWANQQLTYALIFKYPDVEAKKRQESALEAEQVGKKEEIKERFEDVKKRIINESYFVRGDEEIIPTSAHDDGNFIYLYFGYNKDFPVPYSVDSENKESKVGFYTEGNSIIIEKLLKRFYLRKGDLVAEIKTDNLNMGIEKNTGTVDSSVVRELVEGGDGK